MECTRLRSNSELIERYSDFGRQGEDIEGVEGIGDVGEGDDEVMGLAYCEVLEEDGVGFGDEGTAVEIFLFFGHVEPVLLEGLAFVLLFEFGKLGEVEDFVAVLVIFDKAFFVLIVHWVG